MSSDGRAVAIAVEVPPDLELETDPERLRTVLVNLVQNARDAADEATAEGGDGGGAPVAVVARARAADTLIEVSDRGHGIDAEALPHIFDPYFTTKRTGTGLGLAISKNIVESLGGRLEVESAPGGTTVRIELPSPSGGEA